MTSTLAVTCPEDVINLALTRIGYPKRITNIFEGSRAANAAINIYSQTRDALLREGDWGFAERNIALTLLKQAPAMGYAGQPWSSQYPPLPFMFEYNYPGDCLRVRSVRQTPALIPNFDPQPNIFSIDNDNSFMPAQKVILCNVPQAILTYVGQVVDPLTWEADFIEAFVDDVAKQLAATLASEDFVKLEMAAAPGDTATAESEQG